MKFDLSIYQKNAIVFATYLLSGLETKHDYLRERDREYVENI